MSTVRQHPSNDHNPATHALPESPCRLTCTIDTESYGHVHVTASGTTAAETVAILRQTVLELRAAIPPASEPPAPTLEDLLSEEIAKAHATHDTALIVRLTMAIILYERGAVHPTDTPGAYTVDNEDDATRVYAITNGQCACAEYTRLVSHQGSNYCQHALATFFYAQLSEAF